jgi:hypothetical protein
MCCLRRRRLGRCCARSARAAPASTLAPVTVWREAACVPPQAAVAWPSLRLLDAGSAGSYAGARHGVARGGTHVLPQAVAAWPLLRSLGAGCAGFYAGARHGVARGGTHVLPQAAAAWPSLHSLDAGCAGFYAGACHGVARGGTCAASGGGGLAVAALAWRGLRRLLRWRASRCGARRHMCCLRRRWLGRRCARSTRVALALTLARVTVWREAACAPPQDHRIGVWCTNGGSGTGQNHALASPTSCEMPLSSREATRRSATRSSLAGSSLSGIASDMPPVCIQRKTCHSACSQSKTCHSACSKLKTRHASNLVLDVPSACIQSGLRRAFGMHPIWS